MIRLENDVPKTLNKYWIVDKPAQYVNIVEMSVELQQRKVDTDETKDYKGL